MTPRPHPQRDPRGCLCRTFQPEIQEHKTVPSTLRASDERREAAARQRRLESEIRPAAEQLAQSGEHHSTGCERGRVRTEPGEARGDLICVDELRDRQLVAEEERRRRRFPRAIRTGDDHEPDGAMRSYFAAFAHESRRVTARLNTGAPGFESRRSAHEVAVALELEAFLGLRIPERRLELRGDHPLRIGIEVLEEVAVAARMRHPEQTVVEPHFARVGVPADTQWMLPFTLHLLRAGRA